MTEAGREHENQKLAWIYARASHRSNSDTDSVPAQVARCLRRFHEKWEAKGYALAKCEPDLVTSASKVRFADRKAGSLIMRAAKPGDVILVDKMDRVFRNTRDFINTWEDWNERKILFEIIDINLASGDLFAPVILTIMASLAQWESQMKSRRNKQTVQRIREAKGWANAFGPPGTKIVVKKIKGFGGKNGLRVLVWDVWVRSIMNAVYEKFVTEDMELLDVTKWLNGVLETTKIPAGTRAVQQNMTMQQVFDLYWYECIYRINGIADARDWISKEACRYQLRRQVSWLKKNVGWIGIPQATAAKPESDTDSP